MCVACVRASASLLGRAEEWREGKASAVDDRNARPPRAARGLPAPLAPPPEQPRCDHGRPGGGLGVAGGLAPLFRPRSRRGGWPAAPPPDRDASRANYSRRILLPPPANDAPSRGLGERHGEALWREGGRALARPHLTTARFFRCRGPDRALCRPLSLSTSATYCSARVWGGGSGRRRPHAPRGMAGPRGAPTRHPRAPRRPLPTRSHAAYAPSECGGGGDRSTLGVDGSGGE